MTDSEKEMFEMAWRDYVCRRLQAGMNPSHENDVRYAFEYAWETRASMFDPGQHKSDRVANPKRAADAFDFTRPFREGEPSVFFSSKNEQIASGLHRLANDVIAGRCFVQKINVETTIQHDEFTMTQWSFLVHPRGYPEGEVAAPPETG